MFSTDYVERAPGGGKNMTLVISMPEGEENDCRICAIIYILHLQHREGKEVSNELKTDEG